MKRLRILTCALGAFALAGGAVGCGDDDEDSAATTTAAASAETINVTGTEYSFELSATPSSETKSITFENQGEEPHDLIFARINEGYTLDEAFEAQGKEGTAENLGSTFAKPGEDGRPIEIKQPLEPGTYAMVCTLETKDGDLHYDLGMQDEFDIE
jgi:hypothetical protein